MSEEEIAEKLRLLKHYSREFDAWEAHWKATGGKREAFNAMIDAENNFVELFLWLYRQGVNAVWDKQKQEYVVKV